MAKRVERIARKVLGDGAGVLSDALTWAGTFHGIGARLLRDCADQLGLDPAFTIHDREDAADQMNLVRHELPGVGPTLAQRVLDHIGQAVAPIEALENAPAPQRAGEDWTEFLTAVGELRSGRSNWPGEIERARRWYEPHLERIHEDARSDRLRDSAMFRWAFVKRRCTIPASAFYEWTGAKGEKIPHRTSAADGGPLAFAGLWDRWSDPETGEDSCTVITWGANRWMSAIHHRMPAILLPKDFDAWLDGSGGKEILDRPPPDLRERLVHSRMNNAKVGDDVPVPLIRLVRRRRNPKSRLLKEVCSSALLAPWHQSLAPQTCISF
jgi:putative SOS response-associated peptidase YedK